MSILLDLYSKLPHSDENTAFNGKNIDSVFAKSIDNMKYELKKNKESFDDLIDNLGNLSVSKEKNDKKVQKEVDKNIVEIVDEIVLKIVKKEEEKKEEKISIKSIYTDLKLNPLQPNIYDINSIKCHEELLRFIESSSRLEWIKNIKYNHLFEKNKNNKIDKRKLIDQIERATKLVEMINDHDEVVLMDGHGRFIFLLLLILFIKKPEKAERIKIIVIDNFVDKNKIQTVTEWHKLFFPRSIVSKQDSIYNYKPTNSRLVYLNFCGIGGKKGINSFIKYVREGENGSNLMLSFSVLRAGNKTLDKIIEYSNSEINITDNSIIKLKEVTKNNQFKTFEVIINK